MARRTKLSPAAMKLLATLSTRKLLEKPVVASQKWRASADELVAADLAERGARGRIVLSAAGRAYLARSHAVRDARNELGPFRMQHLEAVFRSAEGPDGPAEMHINDAESPLIWLARRKGRDGAPLVSPTQLQAGERLRADFTRAQLAPRMTANWTAVTHERRAGGGQGVTLTEMVIAARQRVRHALTAAGPEFAGLLLDVCCFLKRLDDVERERRWPTRSAKVVLQLALDRIARHYGLETEAAGPRTAAIRTWLAADAAFVVEE